MASTIIAVRSLIARTCCLFIATFGLMRVDVRAQSNPTEIKILEGVESVFEGNIGSEPATFIIQFFGDVDSATQKKITKITGHYYLKKDEISKEKDVPALSSLDNSSKNNIIDAISSTNKVNNQQTVSSFTPKQSLIRSRLRN